MSKLELILLGRFECLLPSGTRISLSMRKAEVLLAYLALTPGLRHPRERLINLLWSDRGEEQARNSLRQCLSAIKKSLGEVADMVLQVDRTTVSLIPELIDVDVHEFERLAAEGGYESLTTAADLYQGEFLEGISIRDATCQEWLDGERSRFKRQFIEILANLAETQLLSHDYSRAIKSAERLVKQDPLGESGWRLLMRAYFDNGDRSHALQAFKRCQQALRDELVVDPEAATIELRDQIAGGEARPEPAPAPVASKPPADSTVSTDHSIAVLPFDNLSGDPEQEYFSDGITDSIILNLSLFPGLLVKSRNSSFAFKQQIKSLGEISTELKVDYIVEGSIRKSDRHIRITVQLIDAAEGNQIWGKRYDSDIEDLLDLEEELSRSIAATVTGQIESDLQRIAIAKSATEQESYDLLLSGIYHAQRYVGQDAVIAIDKLTRCLAKDPDNVRAHVYLYICHSMNFLERWIEDYQTSAELASKHICRALELGPEMALVQAFYAEYLIFFRGELDQALSHINKALEINPNDADALTVMTLCLEFQGKFEAALEMAERTHQLDPYHPWIEWELVGSQYLNGRYQDALDTIANANTPPSFTRIFSITANIKLGRADAARQALEIFLQDCRQSMFSVPKTIDEWSSYIKDNYSFKDTRHTQDLIDCMLQAGLGDDTSLHPAQSRSDDHSIAVLPFDNLSGDPAQEYFSDGITESIILNLSLFPRLNVKSRNSSFAFKQQIKSPGEISRELEVDYLVEGSIRKTDERVRVTVQLVDATSGNQVWGKRYDAEIENLFELEEELSRTIATTVTGQIESDLQRIAIAKGAVHQQSYDLLLQGIYHSKKSTAAGMAIAIEKLSQCLELDPGNALAHATLYACHEMNWIDRWVADFEASRKLCKVHASKALELNPELGPVQVAFAEYLIFNRDYEEAETHLKRALEINPNDSQAIAAQALNLSSQGKFEAAVEKARLALQLDPYHTWARWILSEAQFFCGLYEEVLTTIADTGNPPGFIQIYKIAANVKLGNMEAAKNTLKSFLQHCSESMSSMPRTLDEWLNYSRDYAPFADPALNQEIIDDLLQAGLEEEMALEQKNAETGTLPSILVLPFSNLSGDPEQEYFSDGITDSIIVSLSGFDGLQVKSRHTSNAFRDSPKSIDEIGAELGVRYFVEGSVRRLGDNVRITVQLDDTASGNQVWGKRYDSPLDELFALEEELVQTIAGTVSGRIEHDAKLSSMQKPANDMRAYDYLMRGKHLLEKFNAVDIRKAREQFVKCLEIDANNAEAHTQFAVTHAVELFENWSADRQASINEAQHHLQQALRLQPENASTHAYYAEHQLFTRDFELGLFHADRAVELNPTLPDTYSTRSYLRAITGKLDAALKDAELSLQIDPYHTYMGWNAGEVYRMAGQYQRAIDAFRSVPHMPPSVQAETAACLAGLGLIDEARGEMRKFHHRAREQMAVYPKTETDWRHYWYQITPYEKDEDFEIFYDQLLQAGLCDQINQAMEDIPSIAVLPFENMSGDPEQKYFSDGFTESIILNLGSFNEFRVKSKYASFSYTDSSKTFDEITRELDVQYIVEGSIRKFGDKVRITVQLEETDGGNQLWGKRFESELENLFSIEEELVQTIAGTISGRIGKELKSASLHKPAKDLKSYDYLLRGIYHLEKYNHKDNLIAQQQFQKCLEHDPDNAEAHAYLGAFYVIDIYENWSTDREESKQLMLIHAEKALELEPDNARAHAYIAETLMMHHEFDRAEVHADRAIELNPTLPDGYAIKGFVMGSTRRYAEAIENAEISLKIDPHHPYMAWSAGEVFRGCGQYERAVKTFRSMPHRSPSVFAQTAAALAGLGKIDEARSEMNRYLESARSHMPSLPTSEREWRSVWYDTMPYQYDEDADTLFELLLKAGLCDDLPEPTDDMPSIAVLPFENMSGDPEQEHFADGITADIIATLSKFPHLRTISRYSTLQYKTEKPAIARIAQEQNSRYLLEGNVRKSGERIRVSAQLIDSRDESICWSERYDRDLDDLFAVQDDLTRQIALAMKTQLDDGEMALHRSRGATSIRAWELTLAAVDLQDSYIRRNILEAREMARQAIELDPGYAYAWITYGWTFWQEAYSGWSDSIDDLIDEAVKANRHAMSLEPNYGEVWTQAGTNLQMKHEFDEAIAACLKGVELEPGSAEAHALTAYAYLSIGDCEEARKYEQNMRKLCPILPNWYYLVSGGIEKKSGNLERAIVCFQRGLEVEPESPLCRFYLIDALMEQGDETRAQQLANEIRALDSSVTGRGLVHANSSDPGERRRFHDNLAKFGLV